MFSQNVAVLLFFSSPIWPLGGFSLGRDFRKTLLANGLIVVVEAIVFKPKNVCLPNRACASAKPCGRKPCLLGCWRCGHAMCKRGCMIIHHFGFFPKLIFQKKKNGRSYGGDQLFSNILSGDPFCQSKLGGALKRQSVLRMQNCFRIRCFYVCLGKISWVWPWVVCGRFFGLRAPRFPIPAVSSGPFGVVYPPPFLSELLLFWCFIFLAVRFPIDLLMVTW